MYYSINITGKHYTITESPTRQTRDSGAETIRKVNRVLRQGYTYLPTSTDKFASLTNEARRTILLEIPSIIRDNEYNKTAATASKYLPKFVANSLFTPVTNTSVDRVQERRTARAARLLERALQSPTIRKLYNTACAPDTRSSDLWTIEFVSKVHEVADASCELGTPQRVIRLADHISDDQALTYFIFELTNAIHEPKFAERDTLAAQGKIDADEFAEISEKIEFNSARLHHALISKARTVDKMGWGDKMDIFRRDIDDWDTRWAFLKDTPHAQYYRDMFHYRFDHINKEKAASLDTPFLDPISDL